MTIDPAAINTRTRYKLMIGMIVPRPIAFVSTVSANGVLNLAPFSFFTGIGANPPAVCFCPSNRADGSHKDTLVNIEATGEFVVNVAPEAIAEQMNLSSGEYTPDVDEFALSGLTPAPSLVVKPPRVRESPAAMECRLLQIVRISTLPDGGNLVIGEVVRFHVDDAMISNYRIDPDKLRAIGRMGGPEYVRTRDRFTMQRPGAG
jgi:flavin reductase (DIM6/NTAB) family NADH-FMN oxidoreductase RutF